METLPLLPFAWAKREQLLLLPLFDDNQWRMILCTDKTSSAALAEARRVAGQTLTLRRVSDSEFEQQLVACYQRDSAETRQLMEDIGNDMDLFTLIDELPDSDDLLSEDDDAPIIRLINAMIMEAIKTQASDIHIETYEQRVQIRFRIDGVLREILRPPRQVAPLLISRLKVMARLDIAEKRVPQDGRIAVRLGGRTVDLRVSTLPSSHGERVVLRLLDKNSVRLDLDALGIDPILRTALDRLIHRPHGIILVTGPTGSGKSTTLYAALRRINAAELNIMTVEDPIEYELEGINQTQVNNKVGMTFSKGLRAILRQDPDVVLVGEIRDEETAQIAVQASLTGHLVLSTLHTNSAVGALSRLKDMHVEPFLLATSLLGVLAQRLVRVICPECSVHEVLPPEQAAEMDIEPDTLLKQPVGCAACNYTGYRGRTGIHELLIIDDAVRAAIQRGEGEMAIARLTRDQRISLRHAGRAKVLAGVTSWQEVVRVTREES